MHSRPPRRSGFGVRLELGRAAFEPALGLLAFRSSDSGWARMFLVPAAVRVIVLVAGVIIVQRGNPEPLVFEDIEDLSGGVLGHIGAYLLPVFIDASSSTERVLISAIVVALIIHIHVATGRVFVNPLLYLLGYRTYSAKSAPTRPHRCPAADMDPQRLAGLITDTEHHHVAQSHQRPVHPRRVALHRDPQAFGCIGNGRPWDLSRSAPDPYNLHSELVRE